jgi:LysR family glycine cleavage system transcriptional activator
MFENFAMIEKAAVAGLGAALLPSYFGEQALKTGALVAVAPAQRSKSAYYVVVPETKVGTPHVEFFVKWIAAQTKRNGHVSHRRASKKK